MLGVSLVSASAAHPGAACEAPNALEILDCVTKGLKLEGEAEVGCLGTQGERTWHAGQLSWYEMA